MDQRETEDREYFLGSIVLTTASVLERPSVVDGQQRLAFVAMIFAAIRDYLITKNEIETANLIANEYLYNKDKWTKAESPRLLLSNEDADFFSKRVLSQPESAERLSTQSVKRLSDSHRRIAKAFEKICDKINSLAERSSDPLTLLKEWETFLEKRVRVLVLKVGDESRAFQIFETLNDRGLDLAIADLLKNYIFGNAGAGKLDQVKHHWATAMSRITTEGGEPLVRRFIHHFWSSKHGLTRERLLYKSIRDRIRNERAAADFAVELAESATNYAAILNPESELWSGMGTKGRRLVTNLKNLKLEQYKPLLLACLDTFNRNRPTELQKVLEALVAWSVRFQITQQFGSSRIEVFYPKAAKQVRDEQIKTANALINRFKDDVPGDSVFKSHFQTYSEDNPKLARYYLRCLEAVKRHDEGQLVDEVTEDEDAVNLEHVLPQQPSLKEWPTFDEETAKVSCYRLGNQTLLLKKENRGLGNCAFAKKRSLYKNSDVRLTKDIAEFTK
jgi:hypothetical protein